jgi:hypothetical protein
LSIAELSRIEVESRLFCKLHTTRQDRHVAGLLLRGQHMLVAALLRIQHRCSEFA